MNSEESNERLKEINKKLDLFLSRQLQIREKLDKVEFKQDTIINMLTETNHK